MKPELAEIFSLKCKKTAPVIKLMDNLATFKEPVNAQDIFSFLKARLKAREKNTM
jgi:hypothetical protein